MQHEDSRIGAAAAPQTQEALAGFRARHLPPCGERLLRPSDQGARTETFRPQAVAECGERGYGDPARKKP